MNLVGPVGDSKPAPHRIELGQGPILCEPRRSEELHRIVRDGREEIGCRHFDGRNLSAGTFGPDVVDHPRCLENQETHLFDLDSGIGDPLSDHPLIGQRFSKRSASLAPLDHQVQASLGCADGTHAVVNTAWTKSGLGYGEPASLLTEEVGHWDTDRVEHDLGVSAPVLIAKHRRLAFNRHPWAVHGDDHHRLHPMTLSLRVGHSQLACLLVIVLGASSPSRATPEIERLSPRGLRIGQWTRLVIEGKQLDDAVQLFVSEIGLLTPKVHEQTSSRLVLDVRLPGDTAPGIYPCRLRSASGISRPVMIGVDDLKQQSIDQPVESLPVALHGELSGDRIHKVEFAGQEGQPLVVELEGQRLGSNTRPLIRLFSPSGKHLAFARANRLLGNDARIEVILPESGTYRIELHDVVYKGPSPGNFRLKIGNLKYADGVFPPVIDHSVHHTVQFVSTNLTEQARLARPPFGPDVVRVPWPSDDAVYSGAQPRVRVAPAGFTEFVEGELTSEPLSLPPVGISGRILKPGEKDQFTVSVQPGSKLRCELFADRLDMTLDAVLVVRRPDGQELARADDQPGTSDPGLDLDIPDGVDKVQIEVSSISRQSGPNTIYRLVVTPRETNWDVTAPFSELSLPAGSRRVVAARIDRKGSQPLELQLPDVLRSAVWIEPFPVEIHDEVALIAFRSSPGVQGVFSATTRGTTFSSSTLDSPVLRGAPFAGSKFRRGSTEDLVYSVEQAGPSTPVRVSWGEESLPKVLARGTRAPLSLRCEVGSVQPGQKIRFQLLSSQKPRERKEGNRQVPDDARNLRLDGPATFPAEQKEAVVHLAVPNDLPIQSWAIALRAELVSEDEKQVLASDDTRPLRLGTIEILRLDAEFPGEITIRPGNVGVALAGKIVRHDDYRHPVRVQVEGLPKELANEPVTLPPDQDEFRLPLVLAAGTKPQELANVRVSASFAHDDSSTQSVRSYSKPFKIKVVQ